MSDLEPRRLTGMEAFAKAEDEIARLRAENKELQDGIDAMIVEHEKACDEVERLRKELARLRGLPRLGALEAENERLKAALAWYAAGKGMWDKGQRARAALGEGKG